MNSRPLCDLIRRAAIGPVRSGGREIVRRIFITVRDRYWREIAPTDWEYQIDDAGVAHLDARHRSDGVDFEWQGTLRVNDDLSGVHFTFEGEPLRDIEVCRVGLVVLHPVELVVGARITATGPLGSHRLMGLKQIHPQPIIDGRPGAMTEPFSSIGFERDGVGKVDFSFSGDLFEIEDQRNWGDASFKTYCTPLRLGFPRSMKAGNRVGQSVEVVYTPDGEALRVGETRRPDEPSRSTPKPAAAAGRFPTLGREWPISLGHRSHGPDKSGIDRLAWHQLHVDVTENGDAKLTAALNVVGARIEIALTVTGEQMPASGLLKLISQRRSRIARVLIYGCGTALPACDVVERCRQALKDTERADIRVLAATRGYFVEFNRKLTFDGRDGMAFPLAATVHGDDAATLVENVGTIVDIARSARQLAHAEAARVLGASQIVIAPLALYFPASEDEFPKELVLPWLVCTLLYSAVGDVDSVTLAADVIDALAAAKSESGAAILYQLLGCAGLKVVPVRVPTVDGVCAFALGELRLVAVNLKEAGAVAVVNGVRLEIPPYGVVWT